MKFTPQTAIKRYVGDFNPDLVKILETMLYLMNLLRGITQYQIVKSVFLADRQHLNEVGRPITFDKYVAMRQGPVPSLIYDLLKNGPDFFYEIYGFSRPWTINSDGAANHFSPLREHDVRKLSKTDMDALDAALREVRSTPGKVLEKKLHDDPAYKVAWSRRGTRGSEEISAIDLLDHKDDGLIANLAYASRA